MNTITSGSTKNAAEYAVAQAFAALENAAVHVNKAVNGRQMDVLAIVPGRGVFVVEVKGWSKDHYEGWASNDLIVIAGQKRRDPFTQAQTYMSNVSKLFRENGINQYVTRLVAYPNMNEADFREMKLDKWTTASNTLFAADIASKQKLERKLGTGSCKDYYKVRELFETTYSAEQSFEENLRAYEYMKKELENAKRQIEKQKNEQGEREYLCKKAEQAEIELNRVKKQLKEEKASGKNADVKKATNQARGYKAANTRLKNQVEELEQEVRRLNAVEEENRVLRKKVGENTFPAEMPQYEVETKLEIAEGTIKRKDKEIEKLKAEIEALKEENKKLVAKATIAKHKESDHSRKEAEAVELAEMLAEELDKAQNRNKEAAQTVSTLETEVEELSKKCQDLEDTLRIRTDLLDKVVERVDELEEQLSTEKEAKTEMESTLEELKEFNQELNDLNETCLANAEALRNELIKEQNKSFFQRVFKK